MTVLDLIERLRKFPPDTQVLTCGTDELFNFYNPTGEPEAVEVVVILDHPRWSGLLVGKRAVDDAGASMELKTGQVVTAVVI